MRVRQVEGKEHVVIYFNAGNHLSNLAYDAYRYLWDNKEVKSVTFDINGITVRMSR